MRPSRCLLNALHHDLDSFVSYARRTGLSLTSTTFVGSRYEYLALASLARLGLLLNRTGGRLDKGIDLLGTWNLPSLGRTAPLRVLVQCKALAGQVTPKYIRELEGAFAGVPAAWRAIHATTTGDGDEEAVKKAEQHGRDTVAILVTPINATKGVRDAMGRSRWPMCYVKMSLGGVIEQLVWNKRAADQGLEGIGVSTRFRDIPNGSRSVEADQRKIQEELVLTWNGNVWEFDPRQEQRSVKESE